MILIGDVHGKYSQYREIIRKYPDTIQVGDMGVGFRRVGGYRDGEFHSNPPYDAMVESRARFIRGNHDNPGVCRRHTQWIADGAVENDVMFIGGAFSIDREWRQEGSNWWPDEELSDDQFRCISDIYVNQKPRVVITHDCPKEVIEHIHGSHHLFDNSRTQLALQKLFEAHQPEHWVFGHHHTSFQQAINGTKFRCLAELEVGEIK